MSRGFVKDNDQEEVPLLTPRAYLPPGAVNYVTPEGLKALVEERDEISRERQQLIDRGREGDRVQINYLGAKINQIEERLSSARVVEKEESAGDTVKFGALVRMKKEDGCDCSYRIVGVDEADISAGKISYISPLARVLTGRREGETVEFKTPAGIKKLKIQKIE